MEKKSIAIPVLLLRILTLAFLVASLIILVTDTVNDGLDDKLTFKNFYAYRYVLSVDAIGGAYTLVQILLSVISLITQTYSKNRLHIWLHQFFDVVFALFFATGAGAGFGFTVDTKKQLEAVIELAPALIKYFNLVYVSSALLLMAAVTLSAIILCSAYVGRGNRYM